jgi:hypothetical protein
LASNAELDGFKVSSATYVRPIAAYYAHTTVRNCTFAEAKSSIDLLDSQVTFRDCTFVMDSDWEYAGVFICRGSLNIENCIISVSGIGTTSTLGGIYSDIRLKNTTILHTQTPQTGYGWGPILGLTEGSMSIDNSIVWCPLSPEKIPLLSPSYVCGTVSITGSCISGGYEGVGNISDDPGFVNPPLDLRLKEDSPCINTGLNGLATDRDMLGVPRPQGLRVDMGAYEAPQNNAFLMVNVEPEDAVAAGAQWRRVGESRWRNPGELADGFPLGAIQVEFKPLDEWRIPDTQTVVMNRDDTSEITAIYKAQCLCITRSPVGTFAGRGTTISLSVQTAHGIGTLTYQWKHNGGTIPGATSREWTTPPLTLEDSGDYVCEVSDNERTVASSAATIEVVAEGLPLGPACSFASLVLICLATIFRFKLEKRAERSTVRPKNTN